MKFVGRPVRRLEDYDLLTGTARFTGDIAVDEMLFAHFVRSTSAQAMIASVDVNGARESPGVVAVLTGADLDLKPVIHPGLSAAFPDGVGRPAVARECVRFVGEIVAVVIGETLAAAVDAADAIVVDYESRSAVPTLDAALEPGAPLLFEDLGSNVLFEQQYESGSAHEGEVVRVSARIRNQRMAVAPMETNAILAIPEEQCGRVKAYVSTQAPHTLRDLTASFVGMEPEDLHIVCAATGGAFGGKVPCEAEYAIVISIARRLGRPVRWVQTRTENLMSMQARSHRFDVALEATPDGKLTSLVLDAVSDAGAYGGFVLGVMTNIRMLSPGPYRLARYVYRGRAVATNTAPVVGFRGAGRPEATNLLERTLDVLAHELRLDPVELRRRNLIQPEDFPYITASGAKYDSGRYERALDRALEISSYYELRAEQATRREMHDVIQLGIGVSCYVELSALHGMHNEYGSVEINEDGSVRATVGTSAHGQGHVTTFTQIVAETLGVPLEFVEIVQGDTRLVPQGKGTGGSRSAQVGGSALKAAADAVLEKARNLAAHLLEAACEDVELRPGLGFGVVGFPARTLSWSDLASASLDVESLPEGFTPGLTAAPGFEQEPTGTAPFGCHVAVVELDTDTGRIDLRRMIAVDDCGRVLNPMLAQGQVHGGLFAGISQALFEETCYDEIGNQLTSTLADYAFPSAAEFPFFETDHTETPTPYNPLGAKGIGEGGTTGSLAAVHNAVVDSVAHLGIQHFDLPATPMRIWSALDEARRKA